MYLYITVHQYIYIYIYTEVYTGASYTRMYMYLHICIHTRTALSGRPAQRPLRGWGCAPASGYGHLPLHRLGSRNRRSQKIQILVALLKDFVSDPPDFDLSLPWRPMKGFLCKSMLARRVRPIWGRSLQRTQTPSTVIILGARDEFTFVFRSFCWYVFLFCSRCKTSTFSYRKLPTLGFGNSGIQGLSLGLRASGSGSVGKPMNSKQHKPKQYTKTTRTKLIP